MYSQTNPSPDLLNCFVQKQDTVVIPPLTDPQLQNAAFSVIEATKSQLSELKLADLFSQQLQGVKKKKFHRKMSTTPNQNNDNQKERLLEIRAG